MPDHTAKTGRRGAALTFAELDALGVTADIPTAGRAFGLGRTQAYAAAKAGHFPCRIIQVGARLAVPTAELRAALGLAPLGAAS